MQGPLSLIIGEHLRRVRHLRGWTLEEVARRTRGRFKASSLGGYERGERSISVERFCELAHVYAVAPDHLLADILAQSQPQRDLIIDLTRLEQVTKRDRAVVKDFVEEIQGRRGGTVTGPVHLRTDDIVVLAEASAVRPEQLLDRLRPALVTPTEGSARLDPTWWASDTSLNWPE